MKTFFVSIFQYSEWIAKLPEIYIKRQVSEKSQRFYLSSVPKIFTAYKFVKDFA
jgi:hypothetical protein